MASMQNKLKRRQSGFTIVELLIVIVVIGILATLTIVSYSGITARANTVKAQTNAASAQKVAEAYNADNGYYPSTAAAFTSGSTSTKLPGSVTVIPGLPGTAGGFTGTEVLDGSNGLTEIAWSCSETCTSPVTGGRIYYWDFSDQAVDTDGVIYVGDASAANDFVAPAS